MNLLSDARLVQRALRSKWTSTEGPFKLTAAVTYTCHQRCRHCRIWKRDSKNELSVGEWRQIWRSVSSSLSWLDLTGGEVTNRPDFVEIAIAALEECPSLTLLHYPSNGSLPAQLETVTRAIQSAGSQRLILSISLDGPEKLHNKLRGDKSAFANAVDSFQRIKGLGVDVYFGMTLSSWNLDRVDETVEALAQRIPGFGWRDLHINVMNESPHFFGNTGVKKPAGADVAVAIDHLLQKRGRPRTKTELLEYLFLRRLPEHLKTGRSPVPCQSMRGHAFVNPQGLVYPCHIWDRPVGSLRDHQYSLGRLWSSHEAQKTRDEVSSNRCPGCWTPCEAYPTILSNLPRI